MNDFFQTNFSDKVFHIFFRLIFYGRSFNVSYLLIYLLIFQVFIMEVDNEIFLSDETRENNKIFHSDVTRVNITQTSNLRDLLCVSPATPIPVKIPENKTCPFEPKYEKYYVPKRRSRLKVRTVRDIRNVFEQDNYRFIVEDMERQQNALLSKIRTGSAYDSNTQNLAKILLKADHPISRTAWQMISNINPERKANPIQFVLCNSKRIRVVGSKGGMHNFLRLCVCPYLTYTPSTNSLALDLKITNK